MTYLLRVIASRDFCSKPNVERATIYCLDLFIWWRTLAHRNGNGRCVQSVASFLSHLAPSPASHGAQGRSRLMGWQAHPSLDGFVDFCWCCCCCCWYRTASTASVGRVWGVFKMLVLVLRNVNDSKTSRLSDTSPQYLSSHVKMVLHESSREVVLTEL